MSPFHQILVLHPQRFDQWALAGDARDLVKADQVAGRRLSENARHGPGVPDSEKTRIFERFYRASESRTETNHFGLGLSVAAEIAKAHHTRIQVLDVPGGGAEFRFLLPYGGGADGMAVNR